MPIAWDGDPPGAAHRIEVNIRAVLTAIVEDAHARRRPAAAMALDWHRATYAGIALPVDYYAGEIRDSDPRFPLLMGYEVGVGSAMGVLSAEVPAALVAFDASCQAMVATLDAAIPAGSPPLIATELRAVLLAAAIAHGEWIRIHPFANGNGRTARLWGNWVGVRYGLPVFIRLRPRPAGAGYAAAAAASMRGDHQPMAAVFSTMLRGLARGSP